MLIESPNLEGGYEGKNFEDVLRSNTACGILTIDANGTITALTPEAQRVLNLPEGREPLLLQDLPASLQAIIREVQRSGQPAANRQIALRSLAASPTTAVVNVTPSSLAKPASVVVMLKSDASLAKLEHNLRRLDRLASIGTVSASMAHEIKNAFVAVRTFVDLLLEKNPDADLAGVVRREISRVDSIVSHMLKFAAPAQPTFAEIRLHELLEHSLRLVEHGTDNKLISFHREFAASPDAFVGDDHQLEQAFVNLLFNAVEAMPAEGSLTVSTDLVSNQNPGELREGDADKLVRIRISDTGIGIAPEKLNRIFEPFFTTKPTGTGLGLAVTRRIIREHKGTIQVASAPDQGTQFIVLLPAGSKPA
jgi:signal transduction histidine kinase